MPLPKSDERLTRLEILLDQLQRQYDADVELTIRIDAELERLRVERRVLTLHLPPSS